MKRLVLLLAITCVSSAAMAQKADAAFVVGGAFSSDVKATFTPTVGPSVLETISFDHHLFLEGAASVRMLNAHVAALRLELPVAAIPSQPLGLAGFADHISSLFITPGFKVSVLPGAPISPWASVGGGWAHYSTPGNISENKGALEYGGGLDFNTRLPLLGFRAEVRDFVTGDPARLIAGPGTTTTQGLHHHNVLVGGGIVLRF
ncbi:MAG TPA: hypothetical protein VFP71_12375 [Candidatus Angelobacter sp.]|nr:hypothetical protein [Candidatus Angelobacter sp.]